MFASSRTSGFLDSRLLVVGLVVLGSAHVRRRAENLHQSDLVLRLLGSRRDSSGLGLLHDGIQLSLLSRPSRSEIAGPSALDDHRSRSYTTDPAATKGHADVDWVRIRQLAPRAE